MRAKRSELACISTIILVALTARAMGQTPADSTQPKPYFEFQVQKPAAVIGGPAPEYPEPLKGSRPSGSVVAQFVVNESGKAEMTTFKVVESTNDLFSASVRKVLPQMRFSPAEINGKKVKQVVQLPFEFKIEDGLVPKTQPGQVLLRKTGSSETSRPPLDGAKLASIDISPSDSSHPPQGVYLASQVDVPVRQRDGTPVPTMLRPEVIAAFGPGVLQEFVVNEDGTMDVSTFKILRAPNAQFADAMVRGVGKGMTFLPAQLNGKPVRQLVQMALPLMIRH